MQQNAILIGISGQKGSGKSSVSNWIKSAYPKVYSYSLSEPIKQIGEIIGFPKILLHGSQEDKERIYAPLGISPREFLQKFGTEVGREIFPKLFPNLKIGNNIWIQLLDNKITLNHQFNYPDNHPNGKSQEFPEIILIDDIRFKDEAEYIKSKKGILIRIIRSDATSLVDLHQSEKLDDITPDYIILNNSSIDYLFDRIGQIISTNIKSTNIKSTI